MKELIQALSPFSGINNALWKRALLTMVLTAVGITGERLIHYDIISNLYVGLVTISISGTFLCFSIIIACKPIKVILTLEEVNLLLKACLSPESTAAMGLATITDGTGKVTYGWFSGFQLLVTNHLAPKQIRITNNQSRRKFLIMEVEEPGEKPPLSIFYTEGIKG